MQLLCWSHSPHQDKLLSTESLNGEFILPNVTRDNSDLYMCLPEWESVVQNQQSLNTTMELTVNCECLNWECRSIASKKVFEWIFIIVCWIKVHITQIHFKYILFFQTVIDDIECNTSSPLNVSFGEDVAISCIAKASQQLQYKWTRVRLWNIRRLKLNI